MYPLIQRSSCRLAGHKPCLRHYSNAACEQQLNVRWNHTVSRLLDLAGEHRHRNQHDALPGDPWVDGARAVQLGDVLEALQELTHCDAPETIHEQHILSDISWAMASLGVHDRMILQWLQSQALASVEKLRGGPLARIAWALGHLNAEDSEPLLHAFGQRAEILLVSRQNGIKPTHVSQLAWACAVHNVSRAALQPVISAVRAGAWGSLSLEACEPGFLDKEHVRDDLRRLHPFLLDLQLQKHSTVVDRDGTLVNLCAMARREFVQSAFMFSQQSPSSFQRNVTDALRRNKWLKSKIGRELGFPPYLADDSVQVEVVLLDPIPLLGELNGSDAGTDDAEDQEGGVQIPKVPWPAVGYVVDLYMPAYRLVVEADGPSHWCRGTDETTNRALGRTALKHRLLRDAGYLLVSVPTFWSTHQQEKKGDGDFDSWMKNDGLHGVNRAPTVATAWTGDANAWKSDDLAGTQSRNWPQQPPEHLGGRLLELILEASEETHGVGEQRWDAAKHAREMEFLTDNNGGMVGNGRPKMSTSRGTTAQGWQKKKQRSSALRSGSIFLSRRKRTERPQVAQKSSKDTHKSFETGDQRQTSWQEHEATTAENKHKKKRHQNDPKRAAAVRKLKERRQKPGSRRRSASAQRRPNDKRQRQQSTGQRSGDQSSRARTESATDQAVPEVKLPLNPHDVLGVAPEATRQEIKHAFRVLSLRYHPDRNNDPGAATRFAELGAAAEQLLKLEHRQQ